MIQKKHFFFEDPGETGYIFFPYISAVKTDLVEMPALLMLRGLPGSGKTTLAKLLSEGGRYPVLSVDSYFTDPATGAYVFDHLKNHLAYKACETQAEEEMHKGTAKVFVDNTFTLEWEMEPYFKLAAAYRYRVFVLTVENRHGGMNTHGVAQAQLEKMAAKYKVQLMAPANEK